MQQIYYCTTCYVIFGRHGYFAGDKTLFFKFKINFLIYLFFCSSGIIMFRIINYLEHALPLNIASCQGD